MNNDEFVEYIKKYGDIRPVQEAFEKYPVEEEEHKGKIDAYLNKINKKPWFFYKNIVKYLMLITLYLATRVTPTLVQFKAYKIL